ncbi:MAG: FtsX-like permease family protein, partial [Pseudomonadota bacterium]
MKHLSPDQMVMADDWSNLAQFKTPPEIDQDRLRAYRLDRIKQGLKKQDAALCLLTNPISMRYAADYNSYLQFQSHIPTTYVVVPQDGPVVLYNAYGPSPAADEARPGRALSHFDGGDELADQARLLADDIVNYLNEIGTDNRRVALEYVNPSLTQALLQRGIEVSDGVMISEDARVIKSEDEVDCIRWAVAVAELGISKMKEALRPGITELQLWGLLNYTNLATARGATRAQEVGVRKAVGANRRQLIYQFLGEAVLISLMAVGLGLVLVQASTPLFEQLIGR